MKNAKFLVKKVYKDDVDDGNHADTDDDDDVAAFVRMLLTTCSQ